MNGGLEPAAQVEPRSHRGTLLALIAGNLLPLFGVLFLGWDLVVTFLIFWIENVMIGFYAVLRIVLAEGSTNVWGEPETFVGRLGNGFFFACFYGLFTLFHGVVVLGLFGVDAFRRKTGREPNHDELLGMLPMDVLWTAAVALLICRGLEFYFEFIQPRAYETATHQEASRGPLARMFLLHVVLIAGGALAMYFRAPVIALVLLVGLKAIGDLIVYLLSRKYSISR